MNTSSNILHRPQDELSQYFHNREFSRALGRAYKAFAKIYPKWSGFLFDEHFLRCVAAPLFASYLQDGSLPDPSVLAEVWAEQMPWVRLETRRKAITDLTPAAAHFLQLMAGHLPAGEARTETISQAV